MQIGVPLLKQVSDVIRLSKENVLSNCSILVLSSVMLKSSGNTIFSKFFWNISKTRKQTFYKSIFTVTRKFVYMWLKSRQNRLLIFVTPLFPSRYIREPSWMSHRVIRFWFLLIFYSFQAAFQVDENPPGYIFPEQLSNVII